MRLPRDIESVECNNRKLEVCNARNIVFECKEAMLTVNHFDWREGIVGNFGEDQCRYLPRRIILDLDSLSVLDLLSTSLVAGVKDVDNDSCGQPARLSEPLVLGILALGIGEARPWIPGFNVSADLSTALRVVTSLNAEVFATWSHFVGRTAGDSREVAELRCRGGEDVEVLLRVRLVLGLVEVYPVPHRKPLLHAEGRDRRKLVGWHHEYSPVV